LKYMDSGKENYPKRIKRQLPEAQIRKKRKRCDEKKQEHVFENGRGEGFNQKKKEKRMVRRGTQHLFPKWCTLGYISAFKNNQAKGRLKGSLTAKKELPRQRGEKEKEGRG